MFSDFHLELEADVLLFACAVRTMAPQDVAVPGGEMFRVRVVKF